MSCPCAGYFDTSTMWWLDELYEDQVAVLDFARDKYALPVADGPNLARNGSFTGLADWVAYYDGAQSNPSGRVRITSNGGPSSPRSGQVYTGLTIGDIYEVTVDVYAVTANAQVFASTTQSISQVSGVPLLVSSTPPNSLVAGKMYFRVTASTMYVLLTNTSTTTGNYVEFDNYSIRKLNMNLLRNADREEIFSKFNAPNTANRWYYNNFGKLVGDMAASDPRFDWSSGSRELLLEGLAINAIRNPKALGAVPGVPGSMPTNWNANPVNGLSRSVVAVGNENGIDYVDLRIYGTTTSASSFDIFPDIVYTTGAAVAQIWAASLFGKIVAGSTAGVSALSLILSEYNSSSVFLSSGLFNAFPVFTTGPLTRASMVRTLASATTDRVRMLLRLTYGNGENIDITLRIGLPQLEKNTYASSPIKSPGTGTASGITRSVETFQWAPIMVALLGRLSSGIVVRGRDLVAASTSVTYPIVGVSTPNPRLLGTNGAQTLLQAGQFGSPTAGPLTAGGISGRFGAVMGFDAAGQVVAVNGAVGSNAAVNDSTKSLAYLARDSGGANFANAWYSYLGILRTRPTDARASELSVPV